jgi:hypothetical protein
MATLQGSTLRHLIDAMNKTDKALTPSSCFHPTLINPGLERLLFKNLGFLGFLKNLKNNEKSKN